MKNAKSLIVNKTSKLLVYSLVAISLVSLVGTVSTSIMIKKSQSYTAKVNVAGLQRALSQQALMYAQSYQRDGSQESLDGVNRVLETFERNRQALLFGGSDDGEQLLSPKALERLNQILPELDLYFEIIRRSTWGTDANLPPAVEAQRILGLLNDVVVLEEDAGQANLDEVLNLSAIFSILSVVVTLLLGFLVLRFRISKDHREKVSLHRLGRKFINVFEGSPVIQYALDENFCIVDLNAAGESAFGFSRQKIVGKNIIDFVSTDDGSDVEWWKSASKAVFSRRHKLETVRRRFSFLTSAAFLSYFYR